jgi:hypothetical protein
VIIEAMRVLALGILTSTLTFGSLTKLYVDERIDYKGGINFANAGPYERITANAFSGESATPTHIEVLKPREPTKGNGTLLYVIGKGPAEKALLDAGFIILRVRGDDPAAARDVVEYFRYGAPGILLLSDQRRFVKRTIVFASGSDVEKLAALAKGGFTTGEQNRKVFDILWAHDSDIKVDPVPNGAQVHATKGKPLDVLAIQLHNQMSTGK